VNRTTLHGRLEALEARPGLRDADPLVMLVSFVAARTGERAAWDTHVPEVVVGGVRHPVAADETAQQAVDRIVATMTPPPRAVIACIPDGVHP
jgi:hypothetical protein